LFLEESTNALKVFNISATIARQGGRVQLGQSNMCIVLSIAKTAKDGILLTAIVETQHQSKKPHAEVQEEKMRGAVFPGHTKLNAAIERHPAMVYKN
jgi:hypothetical protein